MAVTRPGFVYWPAAAPDATGGLWLAWSEFDERAQNWRVRAAHFNGDQMSTATDVSHGSGPGERPAVIVEPDGKPLVIYESGERHHFVLRAARYDGAQWRDQVVAEAGSNFRPFLGVDRDGRTWLAWDRFTDGAYHVFLRSRKNGAWEPEIPFFTGAPGTRSVQLSRVDPNNTVWVLAGARFEGLAAGRRISFARPLGETFEDFFIDNGRPVLVLSLCKQEPSEQHYPNSVDRIRWQIGLGKDL